MAGQSLASTHLLTLKWRNGRRISLTTEYPYHAQYTTPATRVGDDDALARSALAQAHTARGAQATSLPPATWRRRWLRRWRAHHPGINLSLHHRQRAVPAGNAAVPCSAAALKGGRRHGDAPRASCCCGGDTGIFIRRIARKGAKQSAWRVWRAAGRRIAWKTIPAGAGRDCMARMPAINISLPTSITGIAAERRGMPCRMYGCCA